MGCSDSHEINNPSPTPSPSYLKDNQKKQQVPQTSSVPNDASKQDAPKESNEHLVPQLSPQGTKMSLNIMDNFIIAKTIKQKLSGLAFTSAQLRDIIEAVLDLIKNLQESERQEEKLLVCQIVEGISKISMKDLRYYKVLEKFKTDCKQEKIRPESLSRIYHSVANAQKKEKVQLRSSFLPQCQKKKGGYIKVKQLQTNGYNVLSAQEVEEVIKFQAVGQKVEDFSTRFKFKFDFIQSQSEDINRLLAENFSRYQSDFKDFKYDLNQKEIMKMAQISRNACKYSDNGVVLLLVYLVNGCSKLEKNGQSVEAIQKLMGESINNISQRYPPGQGLKEEQQHLRNALKKLELKGDFSHRSYPLSPPNKQDSLQKIILDNARIAKTYKNDFEELLQETCLELSIKILMGLKLDSDRPNKKAMVRIKEKMLIAKESSSQAKINKDTVKKTIEAEEEEYKRKVDQLLSDKSDVTFKISDMLRGKCVFVSIPDIILTIEKIKAFALKDEKKRFRIIEIESRFTNKVPISDVTLKIAINQAIVTELQLTIQSNAATYNFAHKVYQLQRAKMFSKIKIVHNYFEEFQGDFKELVIKALNHANQTNPSKDKQLQKEINIKIEALKSKEKKEQEALNLTLRQSQYLIQSHSGAIKHYFSISNAKVREFKEILGQMVGNPQQKHLPAKLVITNDQQLQGMMLALFSKQLGCWESQLGKQIDSVVRSNCSQLLKVTLLSFFFKSFDISKEVSHMLQFYPDYMEMSKQSSQAQRQSFMLHYLQKIFSISRPFGFAKTTARIFYQTQQLQNIRLSYINAAKHSGMRLVVNQLVNGVVFEANNPEKVQFLLQLIKSYLINRDRDNCVHDEFDIYYEMLIKMLKEQPDLDSGISSQAKFIRANKLLQEKGDGYKEASTVLKQIKDDFKKREELQMWLESELLLAESMIYEPTTTIEAFEEGYQKVYQSATALGLELTRETVANSQWRIYEQLFKKQTDEKEEKMTFHHLSRAITQSSRTQGQMLVLRLKKALDRKQNIEDIKINKNYIINNIKIEYRTLVKNECKILAIAQWKNLVSLDLYGNDIGDEGCVYLNKADWKNLTSLNLGYCNIRQKGCIYLSQADWKNLTSLTLLENQIGSMGCEHLSKADWKNLSDLNLNNNYTGDQGCAHLIKADWKNLTSLSLNQNEITSQGCAHLSKANWKNLSSLSLDFNSIQAKGCAILIKSDWKNLSSLSLKNNEIGDQGCAVLSKSDWKNLSSLDLYRNKIGPTGCAHLTKTEWRNLISLSLDQNSIGAEGCSHLAKGAWKNIKYLNLRQNNIDQTMKNNLSKQLKNPQLQINI